MSAKKSSAEITPVEKPKKIHHLRTNPHVKPLNSKVTPAKVNKQPA